MEKGILLLQDTNNDTGLPTETLHYGCKLKTSYMIKVSVNLDCLKIQHDKDINYETSISSRLLFKIHL